MITVKSVHILFKDFITIALFLSIDSNIKYEKNKEHFLYKNATRKQKRIL